MSAKTHSLTRLISCSKIIGIRRSSPKFRLRMIFARSAELVFAPITAGRLLSLQFVRSIPDFLAFGEEKNFDVISFGGRKFS